MPGDGAEVAGGRVRRTGLAGVLLGLAVAWVASAGAAATMGECRYLHRLALIAGEATFSLLGCLEALPACACMVPITDDDTDFDRFFSHGLHSPF